MSRKAKDPTAIVDYTSEFWSEAAVWKKVRSGLTKHHELRRLGARGGVKSRCFSS